jgi:hypothetical protein
VVKRDSQKEIEMIVAVRKGMLANSRDNPDVDRAADDIRKRLREYQDELPVEFILETLTQLGAAPSLLYDDNAHWTVGEDGTQNLIFDEDRDKQTTFDAAWLVEPNRWRRTIREAIRDHLAERED